MLNQISIFAENTKGTMQAITGILREAKIDIRAMVTNDSAEFGIVRMIVSDTGTALDALKKSGYLCRPDRVAAFYIDDECGGLDALLREVTDSNINIDYLYFSFDRASVSPIAILHAKGGTAVEQCLISRGFRAMTD